MTYIVASNTSDWDCQCLGIIAAFNHQGEFHKFVSEQRITDVSEFVVNDSSYSKWFDLCTENEFSSFFDGEIVGWYTFSEDPDEYDVVYVLVRI